MLNGQSTSGGRSGWSTIDRRQPVLRLFEMAAWIAGQGERCSLDSVEGPRPRRGPLQQPCGELVGSELVTRVCQGGKPGCV